MESLPEYLFWSGLGVITIVSVFLGGLLIGLALVGRRDRKAAASSRTAAKNYVQAEDLLEVGS